MKALILLLISTAALADGAIITTTVKPGDWVLKKKDLTEVSRHPTLEACAAAIGVSGDYRCDQSVAVKAVGSCAVLAPEFPTRVNAEGFTEQPGIVVKELPDGSWGPSLEEGYVLEPYPKCWVVGLVPYTGKWNAPDLGTVHEPVIWPAELQALWEASHENRKAVELKGP